MVVNVEVEEVTSGSVRVSWEHLNSTMITGYIVYYSQTGIMANEKFVNSTNFTNSVVIGGLMNNVEYKFQVAAIAELDGDVIIGQRSILNNMTMVVFTDTPTTHITSSPPSPQNPSPTPQG